MLLQVITDQTASYFLPISSTAKLCIEAGCCLLFWPFRCPWLAGWDLVLVRRSIFATAADDGGSFYRWLTKWQSWCPESQSNLLPLAKIDMNMSQCRYPSNHPSYIIPLSNYVISDIVNIIKSILLVGISNVSSAERWLPDMEAGGRYNHLLLGFQATIVQGASLRLLHPPSLQPSAT